MMTSRPSRPISLSGSPLNAFKPSASTTSGHVARSKSCRMNACVDALVGVHDFRAFTALKGPPNEDTVRDLRRFELARRGKRVRIVAEADGFLYKMVRSLVGVLVAVGEGRLTPAQVRAILASRTRTAAVLTAPPQGLFLMQVDY